jgi:hypothetical protein
VVKTHLQATLVALALAFGATAAQAQDPGSQEIDKVGPWTVTSSFEAGVRGVKVEGDEDKYRSDLNYQPGFQFVDSSMLLKSEDAHAPLFDSLLVRVTGWDSDPGGYIRVNAEKLDAYRLDATIRRFNYYNALDNLARGQHVDDTEHTMGDFSLILLPQSQKLRFNLDYSFDRRDGFSTSTYDYSRDEFPLSAPIRTRSDTFSAGFDADLGEVDVSLLQGFRRYRDDSTYFIEGFEGGNDGVAVPSFLTSFARDLPSRGSIHFTRASVHTLLENRVDVTGRFVYSHSETDGSLFERLSGGDYLGNTILYGQSVGSSTSERPNVLFDLGVSVFATEQMTISNTFKYNWWKIEGSEDLTESAFYRPNPNGPPFPTFVGSETLYDRLTRVRQFSDLLEIDYQFDPRIQAHVGYRYTDRSIDLESLDADAAAGPGVEEPELETFDNRTNTFIFGMRARPFKRAWTLYFDFEKGESDNVFTRVANFDYTSVRLRNRIQLGDKVSLNLSAIARDNDNPTRTEDIPPVDFGTNTETRIVSASGDWVPNEKFQLSSGYTYTQITSDAVVVFFFNFQPKQGTSQYFVRDHFAYVNASAQINRYIGVFGAYRFHDDAAAGDREPIPGQTFISSYPYRYQSPEVKVSVRLADWVDWNVGYQYYKFEERFREPVVVGPAPVEPASRQDYSAHLPYTSLRFYIGRR